MGRQLKTEKQREKLLAALYGIQGITEKLKGMALRYFAAEELIALFSRNLLFDSQGFVTHKEMQAFSRALYNELILPITGIKWSSCTCLVTDEMFGRTYIAGIIVRFFDQGYTPEQVREWFEHNVYRYKCKVPSTFNQLISKGEGDIAIQRKLIEGAFESEDAFLRAYKEELRKFYIRWAEELRAIA